MIHFKLLVLQNGFATVFAISNKGLAKIMEVNVLLIWILAFYCGIVCKRCIFFFLFWKSRIQEADGEPSGMKWHHKKTNYYCHIMIHGIQNRQSEEILMS